LEGHAEAVASFEGDNDFVVMLGIRLEVAFYGKKPFVEI
jgi:hypothetical protein